MNSSSMTPHQCVAREECVAQLVGTEQLLKESWLLVLYGCDAASSADTS
jgi:hypothetical protein